MTRPRPDQPDQVLTPPARVQPRGAQTSDGPAALSPGRFGAVDVYYPEDGGARAALVIAADLRYASILSEHVADLDHVQPYQPSKFYQRELPALLRVLAEVEPLDLLIVDGYVDLDPSGTPGLGSHLHREVGIPVIGVAKTSYQAATHAIAVRRGTATRPLFLTAIGVDPQQAAGWITDMAGAFRLPDTLRRVDALSRSRPTSTHPE